MLVVGQRIRRQAARAEQCAVECVFAKIGRRVHENLRDARQRARGFRTAHGRIHWHISPAGDREAFADNASIKLAGRAFGCSGLGRQKHEARGELPGERDRA